MEKSHEQRCSWFCRGSLYVLKVDLLIWEISCLVSCHIEPHRIQYQHHSSSSSSCCSSRQQQLIPRTLPLNFNSIRPEYSQTTAVQQQQQRCNSESNILIPWYIIYVVHRKSACVVFPVFNVRHPRNFKATASRTRISLNLVVCTYRT